MGVPDLDAVMAAMQPEAAADAVAHDGVLAETLVMPIEASLPGASWALQRLGG